MTIFSDGGLLPPEDELKQSAPLLPGKSVELSLNDNKPPQNQQYEEVKYYYYYTMYVSDSPVSLFEGIHPGPAEIAYRISYVHNRWTPKHDVLHFYFYIVFDGLMLNLYRKINLRHLTGPQSHSTNKV